jgi:HNH endonuclease
MSILVDERERREAVRQAYVYRCGYCGVHEEEAGGALEIDHFQPRIRGGGDDLDNLVYCCPTCNRLKGDFWPPDSSSTTSNRLLHPIQDDLTSHICEGEDGQLIALSTTGGFHIARLRLNRPPLIALRRSRKERDQLRQVLVAIQEEQSRLRQKIVALESELHDILGLLRRLLGEES